MGDLIIQPPYIVCGKSGSGLEPYRRCEIDGKIGIFEDICNLDLFLRCLDQSYPHEKQETTVGLLP